MEAAQVFINGLIDKENVGHTRTHERTHACIYIYTGILFIHKKEGNPAICNNMD